MPRGVQDEVLLVADEAEHLVQVQAFQRRDAVVAGLMGPAVLKKRIFFVFLRERLVAGRSVFDRKENFVEHRHEQQGDHSGKEQAHHDGHRHRFPHQPAAQIEGNKPQRRRAGG